MSEATPKAADEQNVLNASYNNQKHATHSSATTSKGRKVTYSNNAPPKKCWCFKRRQKNWRLMPDRKIHPCVLDLTLPDNRITTSKYTWFTFLPKNLIEQFSKLANIYFIIIAVLSTIKEISISNGKPNILVPLVVIVLITAAKDFFEDWKRHNSDNEENHRRVELYCTEKHIFKEEMWRKLRVGHIVNRNEPIPADLVILHTSEKKDVCYIETKNLDGETSLKSKFASKQVAKHFSTTQDFESSHTILFNYDKPTPIIYEFKGTMNAGDVLEPIDYHNFIPRGCMLRNTEFIYGLVVYSGHETKVMLNSVGAKAKKSHVDRTLSQQVLLIFIMQVILCTFASAWYVVWSDENKDQLPYLEIKHILEKRNGFVNFIIRLGNWILIFTNFVPISMLITVEIIRFIQGFIIMADDELRTEDISCMVQTSNLNEELGQVEYIFSDKTGTLTCNQMVFKKLSIGGEVFGERNHYVLTREQIDNVANVDFRDEVFFEILKTKSHRLHDAAEELILSQALCHEAVVETEDERSVYNASSPDEIALVNLAKLCQCEFVGIDEKNQMVVVHDGQETCFPLLNVLKFSSDRKRMSVIVSRSDGSVVMYIKGADSVMLDLAVTKDQKSLDDLRERIDSFSDEGLRTLLYGKRELSKEFYASWAARLQEASTSMVEREKKMEAVYEEIEHEITILGATAIEDRLQDQVGETIEYLRKTDIKLWVLTGDKVGTARSIALSCKLIETDMKELLIEGRKEADLEMILKDALNTAINTDSSIIKYAMVTGDAMLTIYNHPALEQKFMEITNHCKTLIASRVSPLQKKQIVDLVRKEKPKSVTLAIGDGANDVNMITAAHIGIGIKGKEGQQAARASDYSIGEFRHLKRLMYVYGRECYRRNTTCILFNFFKNMIMVLPQFWYAFYNNFSGTSLYDSLLYQFFNLFYASLPIIVYAIFDKEYSYREFEENYLLYKLGQENRIYKARWFFFWTFYGMMQAAPISLITFWAAEGGFLGETGGQTGNFDYAGCLTFTTVVIVANLKLLIFSYSHYFLSLFCIFGSIGFYIGNLAVLNDLPISDLYYTLTFSAGSAYSYFGVLLIVVLTTFIDYGVTRWRDLSSRESMKLSKKKRKRMGLKSQKSAIELAEHEQHPIDAAMSTPPEK